MFRKYFPKNLRTCQQALFATGLKQYCYFIKLLQACQWKLVNKLQRSVVRKENSAIHWIVIFSNLLNMFSNCKTFIKVLHFRVKVTFYPWRVQYPWCHCFLCLSVAVQKITIRWIALSIFRTTGSRTTTGCWNNLY